MLGSSGRPVWILVHEGQEERQAGRQAGTAARFGGRGSAEDLFALC